jgi:integrase
VLQADKAQIDLGNVARHTDAAMPVADAFDRYFKAPGKTKGESTLQGYRAVADMFLEWAARKRVSVVRDVTKGRLREFSDERRAVERMSVARGGVRGQRVESAAKRSVHTVNRELRALSSILNELREKEVVRLSRDDIASGLKRESKKHKRKDFLTPVQIAELLTACAEHDAATFELTRDGSTNTPRYKPIAPFVRFLLLTGLRLGEALEIEWRDVEDRRTKPRIHVREEVSKTKEERYVDLQVAPTALPQRLDNARGQGLLFKLTPDEVKAARKRTIDDYGAPTWSPQALRRTCSTYFTCAFDAWRSAKSVGHSVVIAERHYAGLVDVPDDCETLEQAMGLTADPSQSAE